MLLFTLIILNLLKINLFLSHNEMFFVFSAILNLIVEFREYETRT